MSVLRLGSIPLRKTRLHLLQRHVFHEARPQDNTESRLQACLFVHQEANLRELHVWQQCLIKKDFFHWDYNVGVVAIGGLALVVVI